jgi:hypothetical protein
LKAELSRWQEFDKQRRSGSKERLKQRWADCNTLVQPWPAATTLCLGSGTPGGLFTPSLAVGALLGAVMGDVWSYAWPGVPRGLLAVLGAGGVLAATTQGPISAVASIMELTGRDRSFILPLILVVVGATLVARSIEPRSLHTLCPTTANRTHRHVSSRQLQDDRLRYPSEGHVAVHSRPVIRDELQPFTERFAS